MHKILVQTELVRLRQLGFEVFNPPYLSSYKDQSSHLEWDSQQPTTLPRDVFEQLSKFNFFFNAIPEKIGALLTQYFDAVIVTISYDWLDSILSSVYSGKVIYRTYGQTFTVSEELKKKCLMTKVSSHDDFVFMPHAKEALEGEHGWLKEMAQITPYCLTDDVFANENTWNEGSEKNLEIMVTCPVVKNRIYSRHYKFLKKHFNESHYRYYGAQHSTVKDPQVVGTLPRKILLKRFQLAAGYLYTYKDPYVCYLPPIEMMVIGGPVLFLKGSLLDQFFDSKAPGRCHTIDEAKEKAKKLLNNDQPFIKEVIASQSEVKKRYAPDYVWPIFDQNMTKNLMEQASPKCLITDRAVPSPKKRIYLLHHFPLPTVTFKDKKYIAFDGIVRVMRMIVQTLNAHSDIEVVVTAWHKEADLISGYFNDFNQENKRRVRILVVDEGTGLQKYNQWVQKVKSAVKKYAPDFLIPLLNHAQTAMNRIQEFILNYKDKLNRNGAPQSLDYLKLINNDVSCEKVIVPHYSFFPEALSIEKEIYMYLPDYMPHFFHESGEFKSEEGRPTKIGKAVAKKASVVFCNSYFTKSYLPDSRLAVDQEKIKVFFLPQLNQSSKMKINETALPEGLEKQGYIFYPTQARPNKNLSLLLKVFGVLIARGHDLKLVLTTSLLSEKKAYRAYHLLPPKTKKRILFKEKSSDDLMEVLYRNAALLCFTSLAEGNFPPQVQEALFYEVPIVASDLEFITERIPHALEDSLKLCQPNNLTDFVKGCEEVLKNRELIIEKQGKLYAHIKEEEGAFPSSVVNLLTT